MEVDTRIRTISVAENTVRNLQEVSDVYRISKTTIIRMAMYHGIKRLENGYRPVRDLNRKKKTKLKIELPIECPRFPPRSPLPFRRKRKR